MKKIIIELGIRKTILVLILISTMGSVLLFLFIAYLFNLSDIKTGILISIVIPLILTPILAWNFIKLLLHIETLEKTARELMRIDSLSKVLSRNGWFEKIDHIYSKIDRLEKEIALLYLDVDYFKMINDTYGHAVGDQVLENIGKVLNEYGEDKGIFSGRIGGDEFIVAMENVSEDEAKRFARVLQDKVKAMPYFIEDITIHYTISVGISLIKKHSNLGIDKYIEFSDRALYQAKEEGRDRFVVYKDDNNIV